MVWTEFLGALLSAFLIGAVFYYAFKYSGPWGKSWAFILVLVVGIWFLSALVADPLGPVWYGVAWLDYIFFGILIALLLFVASPKAPDRKRHRKYYTTSKDDKDDAAETAVAVGLWFWILILLLIVGAILIMSYVRI
jgi:hypothetical protein